MFETKTKQVILASERMLLYFFKISTLEREHLKTGKTRDLHISALTFETAPICLGTLYKITQNLHNYSRDRKRCNFTECEVGLLYYVGGNRMKIKINWLIDCIVYCAIKKYKVGGMSM